MKNILFYLFIFSAFFSCKKENNTSNDFDLPIVIEDTTAEFNVLFYANYCVDCPDAYYELYVDGIYVGKIGGCHSVNDCSCDYNSLGIHAMVKSGVHSYKAVPFCGDSQSESWWLEESFEVPENGCLAVYVDEFNENATVFKKSE